MNSRSQRSRYALLLDGSSPSGSMMSTILPYGDLGYVGIGRSPAPAGRRRERGDETVPGRLRRRRRLFACAVLENNSRSLRHRRGHRRRLQDFGHPSSFTRTSPKGFVPLSPGQSGRRRTRRPVSVVLAEVLFGRRQPNVPAPSPAAPPARSHQDHAGRRTPWRPPRNRCIHENCPGADGIPQSNISDSRRAPARCRRSVAEHRHQPARSR